MGKVALEMFQESTLPDRLVFSLA